MRGEATTGARGLRSEAAGGLGAEASGEEEVAADQCTGETSGETGVVVVATPRREAGGTRCLHRPRG